MNRASFLISFFTCLFVFLAGELCALYVIPWLR